VALVWRESRIKPSVINYEPSDLAFCSLDWTRTSSPPNKPGDAYRPVGNHTIATFN